MGKFTRVRLLVELSYDAEFMHGDDPESKKWFFNDILKKDRLILHSQEIGDSIGIIKVLKKLPAPPKEETP